MFVQATIERGQETSAWRVPTAALVADSHGTRLAVVDAASKLKWLPVKVGRDLGTEIEIVSGLEGTEQVVTVLPEGTPDGTQVEIRRKEGA
jgi:multidrug efflux pump subunit AcrA (membrane-fusion protein)